MMDGLPWEAVLGGLGVLATIFGMLIRIDRRIGKLWSLLDVNTAEHKQMQGRLRRHRKQLTDHETRISTLEGQAGE